MKTTMTLLFAVAMLGCPPSPNPPPQPSADAGSEEYDASAGAATCSNWCKRALELKCTAAQPTKAGSSCNEVCTNVQSGPVKWNLRCRISAKSCAEADACPTVL